MGDKVGCDDAVTGRFEDSLNGATSCGGFPHKCRQGLNTQKRTRGEFGRLVKIGPSIAEAVPLRALTRRGHLAAGTML
jgi:hypothetical protein